MKKRRRYMHFTLFITLLIFVMILYGRSDIFAAGVVFNGGLLLVLLHKIMLSKGL